MNKLLCFLFLFGFTVQGYAQRPFEIKTNPFILLIPEALVLPISVEIILSDSWGAEVDLLVGRLNVVYLSGKHYFNPEIGGDRFYIGIFAGGIITNNPSIGGGFFLGKKWLSSKNVLIDLGIGLGRGSESILPYGKIHIGYRFRSKKKT